MTFLEEKEGELRQILVKEAGFPKAQSSIENVIRRSMDDLTPNLWSAINQARSNYSSFKSVATTIRDCASDI